MESVIDSQTAVIDPVQPTETAEEFRLRRMREGLKNRVKTPQWEIADRVNVVLDLLLEGKTNGDIKRHCKEKWKVNSRTIDRYVTLARDKMRLTTDRSKDAWRIEQLQKYVSIADNKECADRDRIKALERIDKILGLEQHAPPAGVQRIEVSGPDGKPIQQQVAVLNVDLSSKLVEYATALANSSKANLIEHQPAK